MQTHLLPVSVPWGKGTRAYWAVQPSGIVIVFVHGFGGAAVQSWSDFEGLLIDGQMSHDVVFYGYDSLRLRATVAAAQLREFLQDLCLAGDATVNGTLEPDLHRSGFLPKKIVLVAHSLGAVVCRRAMLDARSDGQDWAHKVSLGFFAPAHMGAHVLGLVGGVLGLSKLPLAPIAKWRFPILSELEEGSGFLKDLRGETEKAVEKGGADFLRARALAICEYDDVVNCQPFSSYDASPTVLSRDHLQICKPDADYLAPLQVVAKLIQG